ncbi:MAG: hypothetical protein IPH06_08675 [Alphaproteobacteria bacterium]|nr:hypothetical protein [Alphaproteobacteria bacterium]QQS58074.1 MAG: hypothetical protein IPN28_04435 [Alphaproteobacteria bacterium]
MLLISNNFALSFKSVFFSFLLVLICLPTYAFFPQVNESKVILAKDALLGTHEVKFVASAPVSVFSLRSTSVCFLIGMIKSGSREEEINFVENFFSSSGNLEKDAPYPFALVDAYVTDTAQNEFPLTLSVRESWHMTNFSTGEGELSLCSQVIFGDVDLLKQSPISSVRFKLSREIKNPMTVFLVSTDRWKDLEDSSECDPC